AITGIVASALSFIARSAAKKDSRFAGALGPASSAGRVAARFAATGRFSITSVSAMREPPEHQIMPGFDHAPKILQLNGAYLVIEIGAHLLLRELFRGQLFEKHGTFLADARVLYAPGPFEKRNPRGTASRQLSGYSGHQINVIVTSARVPINVAGFRHSRSNGPGSALSQRPSWHRC